MARVLKTFPSNDGLVRSVELSVSNGAPTGKNTIFKRPIIKIVLLVEANEQ